MAKHRLQRLEAPSRSFSLVLHTAGILSFLASFNFLSGLTHDIAMGFGGTISTSPTSGLLADITLNPSLFAVKNALAITAAPLEVLISILYWGIRSIDKRLLIPEGFELHWLPDVGFHLVPAVVLSLDLILFSPPWTIRAYSAMSISMIFAFLYWGWVELCFSKNGWYPYPIFDVLNTVQRVGLFTFSAALMTASTSLLKWVYGRFNGYEQMEEEAYKPLKKTL
ncbi:integral membrane protein [Colletotrichum tofieldiae]|nr:integral membrane protein [Colletotrichum tofieldiae]